MYFIFYSLNQFEREASRWQGVQKIWGKRKWYVQRCLQMIPEILALGASPGTGPASFRDSGAARYANGYVDEDPAVFLWGLHASTFQRELIITITEHDELTTIWPSTSERRSFMTWRDSEPRLWKGADLKRGRAPKGQKTGSEGRIKCKGRSFMTRRVSEPGLWKGGDLKRGRAAEERRRAARSE